MKTRKSYVPADNPTVSILTSSFVPVLNTVPVFFNMPYFFN